MNILRLIRFPELFVALSSVLAGFYLVLFSGLGGGGIGYLLQTAGAAVLLVWAGAAWNEMFDYNDKNYSVSKLLFSKISLSLGFILGSTLFIVALMLSMTISLVSFFIAASYILISLTFNTLIRDIPVLQAVFCAAQFVLIMLLGMSAHANFIYIVYEPTVFVALCAVFVYVALLRVIKNVKVIIESAEEVKPDNDFERESLELSTEIDSVYPGKVDKEHESDYGAACKLSDSLIKRNLAVILPEAKTGERVEASHPNQDKVRVEGVWVVYIASLLLLLLPVVVAFLYSFEIILIAIMSLNIVFLLFPLVRVLSKNNITVIYGFYYDGIISISLFNTLLVVSSAKSTDSKELLITAGIIAGMAVPQLILKKYFIKTR